MNKNELIQEILNKAKDPREGIKTGPLLKKNDVNKLVDFFFDTIIMKLQKDKYVRIVGFGTWMLVNRKARKGRNPSTGAEIVIPARKDIKFSSGKRFKEFINK